MATDWPTRRFASYGDVADFFEDAGWTDGLPIAPPLPRTVNQIMSAAGRDGDEVLGEVPQTRRTISVWQAAVCAVMAGCGPAHFPIVLATWEAVFDDRFNLHAAISSSGGPALTAVVSGSCGAAAGMNSGRGLFGPGNRANATTGRAIRLGIIACLGARMDRLDGSSFGHAGKYTAHFLESDPPAPWLPVRQQLGYRSESTTVTVVATEAPRQIMQRLNRSPEGILRTLAACMKNPSQHGTGRGTYYVIVLGPEHADILIDGGWSQEEIREYLSLNSRISVSELEAGGQLLERDGNYDMIPDSAGLLMTAHMEDILLVTAGGPGAGWSAALPCWTGTRTVRPTTRAVQPLGITARHEQSSSSQIRFD